VEGILAGLAEDHTVDSYNCALISEVPYALLFSLNAWRLCIKPEVMEEFLGN
jgi:hypothetical protein